MEGNTRKWKLVTPGEEKEAIKEFGDSLTCFPLYALLHFLWIYMYYLFKNAYMNCLRWQINKIHQSGSRYLNYRCTESCFSNWDILIYSREGQTKRATRSSLSINVVLRKLFSLGIFYLYMPACIYISIHIYRGREGANKINFHFKDKISISGNFRKLKTGSKKLP